MAEVRGGAGHTPPRARGSARVPMLMAPLSFCVSPHGPPVLYSAVSCELGFKRDNSTSRGHSKQIVRGGPSGRAVSGGQPDWPTNTGQGIRHHIIGHPTPTLTLLVFVPKSEDSS